MQSEELFIRQSASYLREYQAKIERCLGTITDEQVWYRPNAQSNSIGNLILHLCGNVRQWISEGVGGKPFARDRQQEFDERSPRSVPELVRILQETIQEAAGIIESLSSAQLFEERTIQNRTQTVLQVIYHVVEHFSMHTGQIIWITKAQTSLGLSFYDTSSGHPRNNW